MKRRRGTTLVARARSQAPVCKAEPWGRAEKQKSCQALASVVRACSQCSQCSPEPSGHLARGKSRRGFGRQRWPRRGHQSPDQPSASVPSLPQRVHLRVAACVVRACRVSRSRRGSQQGATPTRTPRARAEGDPTGCHFVMQKLTHVRGARPVRPRARPRRHANGLRPINSHLSASETSGAAAARATTPCAISHVAPMIPMGGPDTYALAREAGPRNASRERLRIAADTHTAHTAGLQHAQVKMEE